MLYAITIGRLKSAASRVAVPLAIKVTSQAASAVCDWPLSICTFFKPASFAMRSISSLSAGTAGTINLIAGCALFIRIAAEKKRFAR